MSDLRTIGVLTSGGDAPGMNAAIRAVVRAGIHYKLNVMGVRRGYSGLLAGDIVKMDLRAVSDIISRGGTVLRTSRSPEFNTEEGVAKGVSMAGVFGLDALVVIGGDGSYRGARDLSLKGLPVICLPGTIDNDICSTSYTIGYDTALNTIRDAIDKIRDTAYSHERCSVVEVMGRNAGHIALNVAVAGGAEAVVIPEHPFDLDRDIIRPIIEGRNRGKSNYIIIVAEGIGGVLEIAKAIEEKTGIEARATILGHLQRGGSPTVMDRVMASRMGLYAVELLAGGKRNRIVGWQDSHLVDFDIEEGLCMRKSHDEDLLRLNRIMAL